MSKSLLIIISIILFTTLTASTLPTNAQTEVTQTPAPTKTPSAEETEESNDTEESPSNPRIEPFTQADLQVLIGNVQRPNGIVWLNDNLYTACNGDWTLYEINDTSGSTRTFIYGIRNAHTLFVEAEEGSSGVELWIPDYDTNSLLYVNPNRSPQTVNSALEGPWGIAYLNETEFLVTNLLGDSVVKVDRDGNAEVVSEELRSPTGIVVADEYVFIANNGSARQSIVWGRVDAIGTEDFELERLVTGLQNTTGLVLGEDGFLYFAYALGTRGVVGRVDPVECLDGECGNEDVEIVLYTDLPAPLAGLTVTPDLRLFVHTIYRPEIYWVDLESTR